MVKIHLMALDMFYIFSILKMYYGQINAVEIYFTSNKQPNLQYLKIT